MDKNINSTRVIDPILTTVVQGYKDTNFVGLTLFPRVPVGVRGGTIIGFGKESFQMYNLKRAPGAESKRMTFGYDSGKFALTEDSLEVLIPREKLQDAAAVPGIDLASRAVSAQLKIVLRSLEIEQAGLARDASKYATTNKIALTGADKWSNPDANVIAQIDAAKEAIRAKTGTYPNKLVISPKAFVAIKENNAIIEKIKYTQAGVVTTQLLASLFDLDEVVVGRGIYADDAGNFVDIWGTDAILAYVAPVPTSAEEPSFGYTYTLEGSPVVEAPYYDNGRKSWVYGVSHEHSPVLAGMDAGYLFQNCV